MGFPPRALLAQWLKSRTGIILNSDNEIMDFSRLNESGQINRESRAAAGMPPGFLSVEINDAAVIDAAEMEQDLFAVPVGGNFQSPTISHHFNEIGESDSGKFAFWTERHVDFTLERTCIFPVLFLSGFGEIELILPFAVQANPFIPLELRPGIFVSLYHNNISFVNNSGCLWNITAEFNI